MTVGEITRFLTRNLGWKLLSLAGAFALWVAVASDPELATIVSVPVAYRNYPKDLLISSESASTISIEARGPARQIRALTEEHAAAVLDLASVHEAGERTFTITPAQLALPSGVELVRTVPAQLHFVFEPKAIRVLSVEVPFSGKLPPGFAIALKQVFPGELNVTGPVSHLASAKPLMADPFDLSRVHGDTEEILSVFTPDPELRIARPAQVRVKVTVRRLR